MTDSLTDLVEHLERAAAKLRSGELEAGAAAELVEDCARIASQAAGELDRQARADQPPGQGTLLS